MPPAEGSVPLLGYTRRRAPSHLDSKLDLGHGFSFVIVFPLPEVATDEEEKEFKRKHVPPGKTCRDILYDCIQHDHLKADEEETLRLRCEDDTLQGLRTATIEIFHSLFQSLIECHSQGQIGDDSHVFCFTSVDKDELFMCVRMSDRVIEVLADMCEYPVQLNKDSLEGLNILISGEAMRKLVLAHVKYDAFQKEKEYLVQYDIGLSGHGLTLLPQKDRIRLIYDRIITYVDLLELKRLGLVLHTYPNHTARLNRELKESWADLSLVYTCAQPLDKVREYFGEELGFYFLFVQRVGVAEKFLIGIALVYVFSSSIWPTDEVSARYKDAPRLLYSLAMMVWIFAFQKHWRRTETYFANKWGVDSQNSSMNLKQPINPSFEGIYVGSPVDENRMVLAPIPWKRRWGCIAAVVIEGVSLSLVIVILFGLQSRYSNAVNCESHPKTCESEPVFGLLAKSTVISLTLSIFIKVFNFVWTYVVEMLCDAEQHIYLYDWNAARTAKIFRFQFISTFFAFFALTMLPIVAVTPELAALWGWKDDQDSEVTVMKHAQTSLSSSLKINFYMYVAFGILDMAIPWCTLKYNIHSERRAMEKARQNGEAKLESFKLSQLEEQAKMLEYTGADGADDYMAIMFPLGFVMLFSQAMPLFSSCLSFLAVSTQIRADAWKFVCAYRRPFPEMVNGIGNWNSFLEAFVGFGIALNALQFTTVMQIEDIMKAIIPSLTEHYQKDPDLMEVVEFILYCVVCYLLRILVETSIGDVDSRTALERRRQDLQRARLYTQAEDFQEKVTISSTGCSEIKQWRKTPRLKPGDPMYVPAGFQV